MCLLFYEKKLNGLFSQPNMPTIIEKYILENEFSECHCLWFCCCCCFNSLTFEYICHRYKKLVHMDNMGWLHTVPVKHAGFCLVMLCGFSIHYCPLGLLHIPQSNLIHVLKLKTWFELGGFLYGKKREMQGIQWIHKVFK